MLMPGATPTNTFTIPVTESEIRKIRITYEQNGKIVLQKHKEDCTFNEKKVSVKLSQEETLRFTSNAAVRIQVKILTTGGDVIPSKVIKTSTKIVIDKEVI